MYISFRFQNGISCVRCGSFRRRELSRNLAASVRPLTSEYPCGEHIAGDRVTNSLGASEVIEDFRFAHARIGFFKAGNDHLYIGFARRTDHEIVAGGGEGKDRMLILHSGLDETAVKADSSDFPLVALGQVLVGRHDHIARNSLSIFLPDYVVELAIGDKVHAGKRYRVGCNWADEANRAVPCVRVIGKEEFMTESDWTVGAGGRFVAATRISPCRSLRLSSLDVAIKTFPKKIGAVSGVPDEVIFGDGWVAGCHDEF